VLGLTPQLPFDMGIAFPALAGCDWYTSFDVDFVVMTGTNGQLELVTGVPNSPALAGLHLDSQVLGFQGTTPLQSNALSSVVETN
jgi:hypothetical protein